MDGSPLKVCPRCGEPRILAPECPRCGVLYAKAEARAARLAVPPRSEASVPEEPQPPPVFTFTEPERPPHLPPESLSWTGDLEDARLELWQYRLALPLALGLAWLLVKTPFWGGLLRIFLSMWIHELGHAVSSWLCGMPAFPGPWVTLVSEERSTGLILLLMILFGGLILRGYFTRRRPFVIAGAAGLVLQFVGTWVLPLSKAHQLVPFTGDGGCLVLGTLLMATLYAPRESALRRGWLHWGYLTLGAAAFMDAFSQWWAARTDFERIPFGENEGVGLSDPSKLVDVHGWNELDLIHRYVWLGGACLATLAVIYGVGLLQAHARLRALEHAQGA